MHQPSNQRTDDLFTDVASLITCHSHRTLPRDHSDSLFEQGSFGLGQGKLKRKPSRETLHPSKKIDFEHNCTSNQKVKLIMQNHNIKKDVNVGMELNWLQKNLIASKLGHKNQNQGRQRKVMMRLQGDKQNISLESMKVTSQQLRKFQEKDQQLKEILLTLQRFYEKQQYQNQKLQQELSAIDLQLDHSSCQIDTKSQNISQLKQQIINFNSTSSQRQLALLNQLVRDHAEL